MVNNISYSERQNARPQRGLSSADLLIESKVEGGITRFCAVYRNADIHQVVATDGQGDHLGPGQSLVQGALVQLGQQGGPGILVQNENMAVSLAILSNHLKERFSTK